MYMGYTNKVKMADEEQTQKYSSTNSSSVSGGGMDSGSTGGSGGTGRNCDRKLKQKKVPQRGLGVAQLEKIRIQEERLKNHAASLQYPILLPPPNPIHYSGGSTSVSNSAATGCEMGWPHSSSVCGNWPTFWNGQYNLGGHSQNLDYGNSPIQSNTSNLHYETKTPLPFSHNLNRAEQSQHPIPSPMANISSGTSKASMLNFQLEPPSNPNYFGNNCTALRAEEERMVGMKRWYPFAVEDAPSPSLNFICPSAHVSFIPEGDEIASCTNDGSSTIKPTNPMFQREFSGNSNAMSDPKKKKVQEFGDFLTLAPPKIELPCQEVPDFDAPPYQEIANEPVEIDQQIQHTFYNFLLPASTRNGDDNGNGEKAEVVDLSLKLYNSQHLALN